MRERREERSEHQADEQVRAQRPVDALRRDLVQAQHAVDDDDHRQQQHQGVPDVGDSLGRLACRRRADTGRDRGDQRRADGEQGGPRWQAVPEVADGEQQDGGDEGHVDRSAPAALRRR